MGDDHPHHSAHVVALHGRAVVHPLVVDAEGHGLRHGQAHRHYPDGDDELDGARELRHGVGEEGVADGEVALHGEGRDGQDGGVGGGLRGEALDDAEDLAEDVGVFRPLKGKERVALSIVWEKH